MSVWAKSGLTCKSERQAYPAGLQKRKTPGVREKTERETGKSCAHEIDKDFGVTECPATCPIQKRGSVIVLNPDMPGVVSPEIRDDTVTRAGEREKNGSTSVASCDSGFGQTNRLPGDHVHCTEGLGLELHGRLLEAGASCRCWPRALVL